MVKGTVFLVGMRERTGSDIWQSPVQRDRSRLNVVSRVERIEKTVMGVGRGERNKNSRVIRRMTWRPGDLCARGRWKGKETLDVCVTGTCDPEGT